MPLRVCLAAGVILVVQSGLAHAGLLGIEWDTGNLYSVSTSNASLTLIGSTGLTAPDSLEFNAGGTLYTTTNGFLGASGLYSINPANAAATLVGATGVTQFEGAIAFAPDGTAYGAGQGGTDIYTINLTTGAATVIGNIGLIDVSGLAFRSDGTLVAIEGTTGNSLYSINLTTFATTAIATLLPTLGDIGGLTVQGSTAYLATGGPGVGGTNSLYSIDLFTGATTLIGSFGLSEDGLSGLALMPTGAVPEPASLAIWGLGGLAMIGFGSTRRRRAA